MTVGKKEKKLYSYIQVYADRVSVIVQKVIIELDYYRNRIGTNT